MEKSSTINCTSEDHSFSHKYGFLDYILYCTPNSLVGIFDLALRIIIEK